jgi:hypothetical protein
VGDETDVPAPGSLAPTPPTSSAHGTPSPSATVPALDPSERPTGEPWTRAEVELPAANSSRISAVVAGPGGFVAVGGGGSIEGFGGALAWHSLDGASWSLTHDEHAARDGSAMLDVVAIDDGYVAVGTNPDGAPVWRSTDGLTWVAAESAAAPSGELHTVQRIATHGDGTLLAVGFTTADEVQVATLWRSADGIAWERLAVPDSFASAWIVDVAVAANGDGVVVGMTEPGGGELLAWRITGDLVDGPASLGQVEDEAESTVSAVAAEPAGYLAVGHRWDPDRELYVAIAWASADGLAWEPRESNAIGSPFGVALIDGRGLVAVGQALGMESSVVVAWEIEDSGPWRAVLVEESFGFGSSAVADGDGRLLVVGADGPDGSATVWREPER